MTPAELDALVAERDSLVGDERARHEISRRRGMEHRAPTNQSAAKIDALTARIDAEMEEKNLVWCSGKIVERVR